MTIQTAAGDAARASLPHPEVFAALAPGTDLLLDDGKLRLRVEACGPDHAETEVVTGGPLSDRKGVNVPGVVLPISPLTEKDRADLNFVEAVRGNLDLKTSDGDVNIGTVDGDEANISSSDGDINIKSLTALQAKIGTSDGDIQVGRLDAGRIELRSSDGDIRIDEASGSLKASTGDGDIYTGVDRFDELALETGDGDIEIRATSELRADLDLRGEEVILRGDPSFDGKKNDSMAQGSLNGGGPPLRASTRDGSIVVSSR